MRGGVYEHLTPPGDVRGDVYELTPLGNVLVGVYEHLTPPGDVRGGVYEQVTPPGDVYVGDLVSVYHPVT